MQVNPSLPRDIQQNRFREPVLEFRKLSCFERVYRFVIALFATVCTLGIGLKYSYSLNKLWKEFWTGRKLIKHYSNEQVLNISPLQEPLSDSKRRKMERRAKQQLGFQEIGSVFRVPSAVEKESGQKVKANKERLSRSIIFEEANQPKMKKDDYRDEMVPCRVPQESLVPSKNYCIYFDVTLSKLEDELQNKYDEATALEWAKTATALRIESSDRARRRLEDDFRANIPLDDAKTKLRKAFSRFPHALVILEKMVEDFYQSQLKKGAKKNPKMECEGGFTDRCKPYGLRRERLYAWQSDRAYIETTIENIIEANIVSWKTQNFTVDQIRIIRKEVLDNLDSSSQERAKKDIEINNEIGAIFEESINKAGIKLPPEGAELLIKIEEMMNDLFHRVILELQGLGDLRRRETRVVKPPKEDPFIVETAKVVVNNLKLRVEKLGQNFELYYPYPLTYSSQARIYAENILHFWINNPFRK